MENRKTGEIGEKIAVLYLKKRKYEIIERNCRLPFAEIDIVAKKGEVLVFVEVKTARTPLEQKRSYWNPEDNLTRPKCLRLKRSALYYANRMMRKGVAGFEIRVDVITVRLLGGDRATVRHYQNAIAG